MFDAIPVLFVRDRSTTNPAIISRAKVSGVSIIYANETTDASNYRETLQRVIKEYRN